MINTELACFWLGFISEFRFVVSFNIAIRIVCLFLVLIALNAKAQWNYHVQAVDGINTINNEIACGFYEDELIISSNNAEGPAAKSWNQSKGYHLILGKKESSFAGLASIHPLFYFKPCAAVTTASFDDQEQVFYFSSSQSFNPISKGKSKIYKVLKTETGWTTPEMMPFCSDEYDYSNPFFDSSLGVLAFSSNRHGGQGAMDIWYAYKTKEGWTHPANCGGQVNTSANELYPTIFNGDIYFSSNGWVPEKGFEIFKSEGKQQWMNAIQLESPINSEGDELMILFIDENRGVVSSDRAKGTGGVDLYLFERTLTRNEVVQYSALLECNGLAMPAAMLEFRNTKNELVHAGSTNSIGVLTLKNLLLEQKYKVNLKGINQALLGSCILYLMDSSGNRIRKFNFNEKGELELELLRFVYSNLPIIKNEDESVLDISIEGRIIPQQTRTTITKSPIAIIDKNGDVVAVAYTNETGYFKFDNIDPSAEYVFKLSESAKADRLVIFDNGKSLVLPILDNEGFYRRTKFDKAIELVNESGRALTISSEDVFIINRVYYELNSANLSPDSKEQLDQLSSILNLNPALTVELNAHTDSRGKSEYNYKLSESRAQSIVQYLVSKGISKDRLSVKAWGETSLVNECTDQVVCEEGEHAVNRRTEIKFAQKK